MSLRWVIHYCSPPTTRLTDSQQALLFFALKYKEELLRGQGNMSGRSQRHQAAIRTDKSRLIRQLLRILQTLPVEAIGWSLTYCMRKPYADRFGKAFISLPGLTKIRYVAADLLTALEPGDGSSPASGVGASALPSGEQEEMLAQLSERPSRRVASHSYIQYDY
jgi:hypothetical protein